MLLLKNDRILLKKYLLRIQVLFLLSFSYSTILYAAAPSGYYSTATGSGATLKTQLYNIIRNHTALSYDDLWTAFQSTDAKANGKVWDMYSDIPGGTPPYEYTFITAQCVNYSNEGDCYNREHSVPTSWYTDATPMYTDLFHLYPTDGKVNGMRSNYPFGEVGTATFTSLNGSKKGDSNYPGYSGTVFEPIDEYKGDFARTYFYMATRYENVISTWYSNSTEANAVLQNNTFPVFETWFLNMLAEWHVQDPVSAKETARNDAVYALQGNRNPYIDNPQYVYSVWGVGATGPVVVPSINSYREVQVGSFIDFGTVSTTASKSINIKTSTLSGDLNVTVTGAAFSVSASSISRNEAENGYSLTLIFTPPAVGTYNGSLSISGGGLNPAYSVALTGKR